MSPIPTAATDVVTFSSDQTERWIGDCRVQKDIVLLAVARSCTVVRRRCIVAGRRSVLARYIEDSSALTHHARREGRESERRNVLVTLPLLLLLLLLLLVLLDQLEYDVHDCRHDDDHKL
jgi:hypothetical protein